MTLYEVLSTLKVYRARLGGGVTYRNHSVCVFYLFNSQESPFLLWPQCALLLISCYINSIDTLSEVLASFPAVASQIQIYHSIPCSVGLGLGFCRTPSFLVIWFLVRSLPL